MFVSFTTLSAIFTIFRGVVTYALSVFGVDHEGTYLVGNNLVFLLSLPYTLNFGL